MKASELYEIAKAASARLEAEKFQAAVEAAEKKYQELIPILKQEAEEGRFAYTVHEKLTDQLAKLFIDQGYNLDSTKSWFTVKWITK